MSRRPTSSICMCSIAGRTSAPSITRCARRAPAPWARSCDRPRCAGAARARAGRRRPRGDARRPALCARRRRHLLRPPLQGQSAPCASSRVWSMPDPWRSHGAAAEPGPVPHRRHRGDRARAGRRRQIDVEATTQAITSVVEGWVREHPSNGCGFTGAGGDVARHRRHGRPLMPPVPHEYWSHKMRRTLTLTA